MSGKKKSPKGWWDGSMALRRRSLMPYPKLKSAAEKIFHKWIIKRDKGICFTCGRAGNQAGHFKHNKLDFDEMNLNCQCVYCNHFLSGNLGIYAIKLIEKYGKKKVDDLIKRSNQIKKYTRSELEDIIKKYNVD